MKYKKLMLLICMFICILCTVSCVCANDVANETISSDDLSGELQANHDEIDQAADDSLSTSVVYFDANAADDNGNGTKTNPYKYYKSDRVGYGTTAYFANGVYDIKEADSIYSSLKYKTTFIGQSKEHTYIRSNIANKFDFTVTENSYFVLNNITMIGIHINNQANLIADNVLFRDSTGFNPDYPPSLSYSYISKEYDASYGGVIICDTPQNKITTLNLTDCTFKTNTASSGGVIATYNSLVNIDNCVFYNSSAKRFGGVIYSLKSTFNIKDSSFTLNSAKYAGAIYAKSSEFNIRNSEFSKSQSARFGGVLALFSSDLDINNAIFDDYASLNDAGGSIYSIEGTVNVADSSFKNGFSNFGGAICNLKSDSLIKNSEFVNNTATYYGGSIYSMYGSIVLTQNNFINTHASIGGTIFDRLSSSIGLTNNRFTDSAANDGPIVFIDGGIVDITEKNNTYDTSNLFLKYGNVYDIDYHMAVPLINYSVSLPGNLPSSYDSRKYGYITPVQDQIQGGNCWAFSGIATLEACIKKATGITYDFSEENVKNIMSDYALFDLDTGVNSGGNLFMVIAYLAGWFGPTYDVNDVYDDHSSLSIIYDSIVHVQNVYILPERQNFFDNDPIKKAVMAYGAVSVGIDLTHDTGHAVTIVGWDDEYTSNDFLGNKAVGAWIIKNSWGTEWGYDGFGYLSYQQPISFGYTFLFNDDRQYTNIYQYDFAGKSGMHSINEDVVYVKTKFTAERDEILSAVSTYFDEPSNFTVTINLNGKQVTTQEGCHEKGYYTVQLADEIDLKKGDEFEVIFKFFNSAPVYIPMSSVDGLNQIYFNKGVSYFSIDGKHWTDLYEANSPGIACIKAFTRNKEMAHISIESDKSAGSTTFNNINIGDIINIQLDIPESYTEDGTVYPLEGLVTFTVNGENYYAPVENGKACLNISFEKEGNYDVKAQFKSSRVVSNLIDFSVNVVKTEQADLNIRASDVSKFYGGPEHFVATLTKKGNPLSNVNVKVTVDGVDHTVKTDAEGQVVLDLDLPVGIYEIYTHYGGKTVVSKFTVLTTIKAEDITQDFLNSYALVSFLNTNGSVLTNQKISYTVTLYGINSQPVSFSATTDDFGVANAKINLFSNKYLVSVVNPVNDEKKEFIFEILPIDSTCLLSVTQSGSDVTINATLNSIQATGYVNFLVSGKIYKVKVQDAYIDNNRVSVASLTLKNMAVGDYSVEAIYSGDDNFKVSSATSTFSVVKNPNKIDSNNYWSYYGGSGTMAKITDSKGNPIEGEVVSATINNKTYTNKTDKEGSATFYFDLPVGNYSVLFEYKGQSIYKHVFVYSTMNLASHNIEYMDSKIGTYFIYPYAGNPPSSFDVKFIIDGKEYKTTADSSGYASVNVDLPVGTHTITTINLCNHEEKQSEITIYKSTPKITLTKSKRGDFIVFTASLSQTSAVGNLVFTMGSEKYPSLVENGKAILALKDLEEGPYEIYANYIGDYNFNNILSDTLKFDYVYTSYNLTAPKVSKYYGGSEKFQATLTNFNKPVANEIINVTVDGKTYHPKTNANGVAILTDELSPGIHSITCTYDDKIEFSEIYVISTIIVHATDDVSYTKVTAEFIDGSGDAVQNKAASFKVGSTEYKKTTDLLGSATLEPSLKKGTYNVDITNPVTGEVKSSKLIITKETPTLELSLLKENGVEVLKAVLPKTATGEVNFVLDNGEVYSADIVNGVSSIICTEPGEITATVTYSGNDVFTPVTETLKFTITEEDLSVGSILKSSKVTTNYGTSKNIIITLKDAKGDILVGRKVTVNLNRNDYEGIIASDGEAIIAIPSNLPAKTYTALITYAGEKNIHGSSIIINVVVKKVSPKLTAAKKTFKVKDKTKKYVVTLKTNKNKVFKNQKVTIKVKGKTYTAKTNSKGQAIFKLKKLTKKGTFKATVKYVGNTNYKAVSKTVKITVK